MEFRNLGKSGLRVSLIGLGCNNFGGRTDLEASRQVVHRALDAGITLFDTADSYANKGGSEEALGTVLGARRKDIVLATKFADQMDDAGVLKGGSRRYIMHAVEASLKRLKTDWIDLYQLHFPDPLTPIEETLRALEELIRQGKVRYIGCSNLAAWQLVEANWTAGSLGTNRFISCQAEYSLLVRHIEAELLPAMAAYHVGLLPYFPLASGLLTGKYQRGVSAAADTRFGKTRALANRFFTDQNLDVVEALHGVATARGLTMVEMAFGWLAAQPHVASVIAGATKPGQIDENVNAGAKKLTDEDMVAIANALAP